MIDLLRNHVPALAPALLAVLFAAVPASAAREMLPRDIAVLQGLDKGTARTATFEVKVGEQARFGTLVVTVRACRQAAPIETPESAAFLEVAEARAAEGQRPLFSGWMFASSPALSALEHPVYDVWVIDCKNASTSGSSGSVGNRAGN